MKQKLNGIMIIMIRKLVLMKKALKILLTIVFIVSSIFAVNKLVNNIFSNSLFFVALAFTSFAMHLFAWVAPKTFFNLCWKITNLMPDNFDYDTGYSKLEMWDIVLLITSILLLGISFLFK